MIKSGRNIKNKYLQVFLVQPRAGRFLWGVELWKNGTAPGKLPIFKATGGLTPWPWGCGGGLQGLCLKHGPAVWGACTHAQELPIMEVEARGEGGRWNW